MTKYVNMSEALKTLIGLIETYSYRLKGSSSLLLSTDWLNDDVLQPEVRRRETEPRAHRNKMYKGWRPDQRLSWLGKKFYQNKTPLPCQQVLEKLNSSTMKYTGKNQTTDSSDQQIGNERTLQMALEIMTTTQ